MLAAVGNDEGEIGNNRMQEEAEMNVDMEEPRQLRNITYFLSGMCSPEVRTLANTDLAEVADELIHDLHKSVESRAIMRFGLQNALPQRLIDQLWITAIVPEIYKTRITSATLYGILFVAHCMRSLLEDDELPNVDSLEDWVDSLERSKREISCIDGLFAVGGSIKEVVRAITIRASRRHLYNSLLALGA